MATKAKNPVGRPHKVVFATVEKGSKRHTLVINSDVKKALSNIQARILKDRGFNLTLSQTLTYMVFEISKTLDAHGSK